MALPALDPHPYGCPLCLACTPSEMPELVLQAVLCLRDLLFPTIHVVNPSRGASYPLLNLHADPRDERPRLVLFPGWEDDRASVRRRVDYGRQATLLQRIHASGVRGERLEEWHAEPIDAVADAPLCLPLAVTAHRMAGVVYELLDYLGDKLRLTVVTLPRAPRLDVHVVRLYAPAEHRPRVTLVPGWSAAAEIPRARVDAETAAAWLRRIDDEGLPEIEAPGLRARLVSRRPVAR